MEDFRHLGVYPDDILFDIDLSYTLQQYIEIIQFLVSKGVNLEHTDSNGRTAILHSYSDDFTLALLRNGSEHVINHGFIYETVLTRSGRLGHIKSMKYIIEELNENVNECDGMRSPLSHLCMHPNPGGVEGIKTLLKYDADIESRDFVDRTPLYCVFWDIEAARVLLKAGANPNSTIEKTSSFGWNTAIHCKRDPEIIRLLIKYGAKVDAPDSDGNTPLMCLLGSNHVDDIVTGQFEVLIENGASCLSSNYDGKYVSDMRLANVSPFKEFIKNCIAEETWKRRKNFLLVMEKGNYTDINDTDEGGVIKIIKKLGYKPNDGFVRNIISFI